MRRKQVSEAAALEQRRREHSDGGARVEMRLDFEVQGKILLSVGGVWDRRLKMFDGDATTGVVVKPHPGQVETVEWFLSWLRKHATTRDNPPQLSEEELQRIDERVTPPDEVYSCLLAGGRRAGKTWIAAAMIVAYAIQFPNAITWAVNPTDSDQDEVRRYVGALLKPEWVVRETANDGWELINGSAIMLKSGYIGADSDAIKKGEAHLVWLNEGQKMKERVYVVARGATSDKSGLVLICANPPVEAKDQQWVADFAAAAMNRRRAAVYYHFSPLDNPHINRLALLELKRETDRRTFRIEALGEFLPPKDAVAHNWMRTAIGNERLVPLGDPRWTDVTDEFLRRRDLGDGLYDLIGMDFQVHPWMGGPVYRVYVEGRAEPTEDNVVLWGVDEIVIVGDEEQWCEEAIRRGYVPDETLIVGDGTGEYQHARRGDSSAPPEWHGRGSFDIIRSCGFMHIVRPDPKIKRNNPHVLDRVRAMTALIESADQRRRLFLDPDRCPLTSKSIREWPTVHGKPSRTHEAAHLGDGASYPIVRLFPRLFRSGKTRGVMPKDDRPTERKEDNGLGPLIARRQEVVAGRKTRPERGL